MTHFPPGQARWIPDADAGKLRDQVEPWIFFLPTAEDAGLAAKGELGLNCEHYEYAATARDLWDRPVIVVSPADPQGAKLAEAVARTCRQKKAKPVRVWTLPGLGTDNPTLAAWCGEAGVRRFELSLAMEEPWKRRKGEAADARPEPETHAEVLLRLAKQIALFRTPEGEAFATLKVKGKLEHHPMGGEAVARWLLLRYVEEAGKVPSAEALTNTIKLMEARAQEEAPEAIASLRVGRDPASPPYDPAYYLDLGDDSRAAVRITADGWKVVHDDLPVRFRRPKGMGALPVPQGGEGIELLWDFVNVSQESDKLLVIASLTNDFLPAGPYPVKVISGEQGSAKSTTTKLLKKLVDPASSALRSAPKEVRDLMIAAKNTWVMAFDNLSTIPVWLSDSLARIATGGGFATRKMYSDDEEALFEATRPIILNSIEEIATRADLLDRAIILNCPVIPDALRREEREFWAAFEVAYPKILGSLLDAVSRGVAMLPAVRVERLPRMADFARWGEAVCQGLGHPEGAFLEAYLANRNDASASVLEDSPLTSELMALGMIARATSNGVWNGTVGQLLSELRERAPMEARDHPRWPKVAWVLSSQLRRLAPALRKVGIDVRFPPNRTATARPMSIVYTDPPAGPNAGKSASCASSASSVSQEATGGGGTQTQSRPGVPF